MKFRKVKYLIIIVILFIAIDKVKAYTEYSVGDIVSYNGINFYVIKNSDNNDSSVTLLKETPLTIDEVELYGGSGTDNNHVNNYSLPAYFNRAWHANGYGGVAYYGSENCGYTTGNGWIFTECKTNYADSDIKYIVDAWAQDKFSESDLVVDKTGYSARLI